MKKGLIVAVAVLALLGTASSSFALLCASDQVPAATLLYPFVTGRYAATSTSTNPVADRTAPTTLLAITNVSSSARIVHNVLWNDFSFPLLDWDVLLTGYDVITYSFADIMEGQLKATGSSYSPTGQGTTCEKNSTCFGAPVPAQGPVPSFFAGIPSLPGADWVGDVRNRTNSIYGLCTNPTYTVPFTVDTRNQANRLPEFNRARIYNGLRQSQVIAENGWYGAAPPYFETPTWLLNRSTAENVWAYITSDVVAACGFAFPSAGGAYFNVYARPMTVDFYAANAATNFPVQMGNTLIGDWIIVDSAGNGANGNPAVHIEMDNQPNLGLGATGGSHVVYPRTIANGASFYRYSDPECRPNPEPDSSILCTDFYTGTGVGVDYTTIAAYLSGTINTPLPTGDFREPLPSAFAFRWLEGGAFDGGTKMRVWKEYPDTLPYYGFTYIYSPLQYAYYGWDEQERIITVTGGCDVSPCPAQPGEINQLPLEVQEVSTTNFLFPRTDMTFGWALFAFAGSNQLGIPVPNGYFAPAPNTFGTQAWIEVQYEASGKYGVDFSAAVLGNYLCDGLAVSATPATGVDVTDLGDVLY